MIDFKLPDEETLLLKATAERFIADHYELALRNEMLTASAGQLPAHWGEMAELGWLAAPVSEEAGGLGLTPRQVVPFMSVLGAGLVLEPIGPVVMHCAPTLARALPSDKAAAALAPVLAGESIELIAAGPANAPIRATREGDDLVLTGSVPLLIGGAQAAAFWVVAECEGAPLLVRVPAGEASVEAYRVVDGQSAARVSFKGVRRAAPEAIAGCEEALAYGNDLAMVGKLAELAGLIDRLYRETLEYMKLREQFGRPIGRFQVIQHRMADMFIKREEAQSMVFLAAEAMASDDTAFRSKLVCAAQVKIYDNARAVLRDAVQLHGGMGVTDELPVGHMVKRLLLLTRLDGGRMAGLRRFRAAA
ncbi:acyl-CoA dehydrogenase family protein [Roseibium marinum]|uniref:Alkylation response protein AidB-like acyl-CoA dehydrogenase n=1 Tax=Roseibium marinum TaxID=281252 RepID=A0A2S3V1S7_9HYPH|nr:acyl-CoA dehydrogenase family protein [Roseibium marinum]POF33898.1 alkylation response protein AidB-like acyl-CoA dehydrogenase [Roseibium marinum]